MTSAPDYLEILQHITTDDVLEFFKTVPGGGSCPMCDSPLIAFTEMSWDSGGNITQDKTRPALTYKTISEHGSRAGEGMHLPCLSACCDTCGFMAYFSTAPLLEWKARHDDN